MYEKRNKNNSDHEKGLYGIEKLEKEENIAPSIGELIEMAHDFFSGVSNKSISSEESIENMWLLNSLLMVAYGAHTQNNKSIDRLNTLYFKMMTDRIKKVCFELLNNKDKEININEKLTQEATLIIQTYFLPFISPQQTVIHLLQHLNFEKEKTIDFYVLGFILSQVRIETMDPKDNDTKILVDSLSEQFFKLISKEEIRQKELELIIRLSSFAHIKLNFLNKIDLYKDLQERFLTLIKKQCKIGREFISRNGADFEFFLSLYLNLYSLDDRQALLQWHKMVRNFLDSQNISLAMKRLDEIKIFSYDKNRAELPLFNETIKLARNACIRLYEKGDSSPLTKLLGICLNTFQIKKAMDLIGECKTSSRGDLYDLLGKFYVFVGAFERAVPYLKAAINLQKSKIETQKSLYKKEKIFKISHKMINEGTRKIEEARDLADKIVEQGTGDQANLRKVFNLFKSGEGMIDGGINNIKKVAPQEQINFSVNFVNDELNKIAMNIASIKYLEDNLADSGG